MRSNMHNGGTKISNFNHGSYKTRGTAALRARSVSPKRRSRRAPGTPRTPRAPSGSMPFGSPIVKPSGAAPPPPPPQASAELQQALEAAKRGDPQALARLTTALAMQMQDSMRTNEYLRSQISELGGRAPPPPTPTFSSAQSPAPPRVPSRALSVKDTPEVAALKRELQALEVSGHFMWHPK